MRIRTALIGFALATLAVAGTATGASAHSIVGYGAKYHNNTGSAMAGRGQAGATWSNEGGSEGGFSASSD
ncbi:hypothetical protein [Kitasatospora kifunensis]|uniref:Uncharacterized protein n=1 Tax=Kitasatospora kifunensis TaxID=58351 RepID=A0A7W7VUV1_KITKI|nr:hypothetical protein [Kitasatospora kifunensis]MBB4923731.1 hypothetical protein [Kitasatospora kifunensis]